MKLWWLYKRFPWLEYKHRIIARLPENASLLDIGTGAGCSKAKLFKFMRPDLDVYATDIRDVSKDADNDISFFMADITEGLPKDLDNKFDCVTAMHLLEHLPVSSYNNVLANMKKVLKPGGVLYLETPGVRSLLFPSLSIGQDKFHCPINFYDDPTHVKPFSKAGLFYLMKHHGFTVKRTGIARNLVFALCAPVLIITGILVNKRLLLAIGLCHCFGWSVFGCGIKAGKKDLI